MKQSYVGAPKGNRNAATTLRPWTDALRKAVYRIAKDRDEDGKKCRKLDLMASRCLNSAMDGDMDAIKEIGNRLEGRPAQPISGVDGADLQVTVHVYRESDQ